MEKRGIVENLNSSPVDESMWNFRNGGGLRNVVDKIKKRPRTETLRTEGRPPLKEQMEDRAFALGSPSRL
jgi:hypothetical protein